MRTTFANRTVTGMFGKPADSALPLGFRLLRAALGLCAAISTELAGRWVNRLWFRSRRYPEPDREKEWLRTAQRLTLTHRGRPVAVSRWGEGPTILLVHGWHGRGAQLGAFAAPLVEAGYCVVAFDAPAHGRTPGSSTDLPEVSEALCTVAAAFPPLHGVITHSFGAAVTLYAIAQGLAPKRVVAVSAPASIEFLMDSFAARLGISDAVMAVHRRLMEERFGADLWQRFSPSAIAGGLRIPALLVHDDEDHDVPWQEGAALARAWSRAELIRTRGLGHRRILRDLQVVDRAVRFLADGAARNEAGKGGSA
jgi:pimeloyl-ACP methyl ester carboxylesterase